MANNYTVSTFTAIETIGDQVANANMISSGTLTITPNVGYVIQATDFSIGSALPSEVSSVAFTNSGTANAPLNTVIATVNFQSSFTITGNITLNIDIDGAATFLEVDTVNVDVGQTVFENTDANVTTTISGGGGVTVAESTVGATTTTTLIGEATPNKAKFIAIIQLDAAANYYFRRQPYFTYQNVDENIMRLSLSSVVRDSNNFITRYIFNVVYKNNVDTSVKSGSKVILNYEVKAIPTFSTTKQITKVNFGSTTVDAGGENRKIRIYGTKEAELDLTVTDNTDGKSILDTDLANTTVLDYTYGSIDALNIKLVKGAALSTGVATNKDYYFFQNLPAYNSTILTTAIDGALTGATTATFDALTNVRVGDKLNIVIAPHNLKGIDSNSNITVTAINSSTVCVLSEAITVNNNQVAVFTREQSYDINLFPKRDVNGNLTTTLNSTISSTLPTYTINQYMNPKLRLLIGTATSGKMVVPDQSDAFSVYAIGKPNAFPSDLSYLRKKSGTLSHNGSNLQSPRTFSISYSVTHASGTFSRVGNNVIWSSTEAFNSSPTTTSCSWTNSIPENNGGTHIEIVGIKDTLAGGAASFTITANVVIHKWGTKDVTMVLDLDKIYT
tara:strand:- start:2717 stop:4564 length:1848 start_codon:yes stop_codon:yes gene_type:complete